jgi:hypothetical protein
MDHRIKHLWPWFLLLAVSPILLPAAIVGIIALEHLAFGSSYFVNGLEAIGLTPILQALFDFLGING